MPNGFIGVGSRRYLQDVSSAHSNAVTATSNTPSHAPTGPRAVRLPFTEDDAATRISSMFVGQGRGDSSNIIVDQPAYQEICTMLDRADDRMGECIYRTAMAIQNMCETILMLPQATPRCLGISNAVRDSLGELRSLTEDIILQTNRFAREVVEIQ